MATQIQRSYLLGRSTGDVVEHEREETVSDLILRGFKYAPLAMRKWRGFAEWYELRSDLLSRDGDGRPEGVAMRVSRRILDGLGEKKQ